MTKWNPNESFENYRVCSNANTVNTIAEDCSNNFIDYAANIKFSDYLSKVEIEAEVSKWN